MDKQENKDKYIHVRIEESFKNDIAALAKENGLNISTLVNMLLRKWFRENK